MLRSSPKDLGIYSICIWSICKNLLLYEVIQSVVYLSWNIITIHLTLLHCVFLANNPLYSVQQINHISVKWSFFSYLVPYSTFWQASSNEHAITFLQILIGLACLQICVKSGIVSTYGILYTVYCIYIFSFPLG